MSSPALVFVHGWGQAAQTWHAQIDYFGARHKVLAANLSGHGGAPDRPAEDWEDALLEALPDEPAILVGWSLGGMLALSVAARHPERLAGLVLLSATPSFRRRPGWRYGCADQVLERFRTGLQQDAARLLDRFFAMMLQGDKLDRENYLNIVRHTVDRRHPASKQGLEAGLQLLDTLDLREGLSGIDVSTLVVHGAADTITPVGASRYLAERIPGAKLRIMPAGHAPHLTRPQAFDELLEEWCLNNISTYAR